MSIPVCKHCSKAKKYHHKQTLHCPNPSRSLMVTYSTENVYEEVAIQNPVQNQVLVNPFPNIKEFTIPEIDKIMHDVANDKIDGFIEKNSVLEVSWNGKELKFDVEWKGYEVFGDCLNDIYFGGDDYKDDWDTKTEPQLTVVDKSTGQRSNVKFEPVTLEWYSDEERKEPIKNDFLTEYTLDDLKDRIDDFILPLYDKQWVLDKVRSCSDADCDDEVEDIERVLKTSDGSIVLGKPDTAQDGTYVMFGIKSDGYVDEMGLLDNILFKNWRSLDTSGLIEIGTFEGHMSVDENENKGITTFITEVIGRSLFSTDSIDISTTSNCKAFLKSEYNVTKSKRIKKEKWGKIEYRLFEDDNGEQYTIVSYNDKLISHYAFSYAEDY